MQNKALCLFNSLVLFGLNGQTVGIKHIKHNLNHGNQGKCMTLKTKARVKLGLKEHMNALSLQIIDLLSQTRAHQD